MPNRQTDASELTVGPRNRVPYPRSKDGFRTRRFPRPLGGALTQGVTLSLAYITLYLSVSLRSPSGTAEDSLLGPLPQTGKEFEFHEEKSIANFALF